MNPPKAFLALARAVRATLLFVLFTCLAPISLHAEWITFGIKAPLTYIEEPFSEWQFGTWSSFYEYDGEAAYMGISGYTEELTSSMTIYCGNDFALIDAATIQNAANQFISLSFQPRPGYVPTLRVLLPSDRAGHSLAVAQLDQNGVPFNTTLSIVSYPWLSDGSGSATYYPKAIGPYDPAKPFWIVDLTDRKKAPQNSVDLRFATWEPDYAQYPLVSVAVYLEGREAGHRFTVHRRVVGEEGDGMISSIAAVGGGDAAGPANSGGWANNTAGNSFQVIQGSATMTFEVGQGMEWWLSRDADGATSIPVDGSGPFVAELASGNGNAAYNWALYSVFPDPPQRPAVQQVTFRINYDTRGNHNFSFHMSDGYDWSTTPSYGSGSIDSWDDYGVSNALSLALIPATVDPRFSWWLVDDTTGEQFSVGQTDILDGWTPMHTIPPPAPTLTIKLPEWRQPGYLVLNPWFYDYYVSTLDFFPRTSPQPVTFEGVDGMASFTINSFERSRPTTRSHTRLSSR
jgi:hypothetical protein